MSLIYSDTTYRPTLKVREYYKYDYTSWTNPILTSNGSNINFRITACGYGNYISAEDAALPPITTQAMTNAWYCFDNNVATRGIGRYLSGGHISCIVMIDLTNPIQLKSYSIKLHENSDNHRGTDYVYAFGSSNRVNWTRIAYSAVSYPFNTAKNINITDSNNYYQYFAFVDAYGGGDNDDSGIQEIYLSGTQRRVIAGTPEDFEFSKDNYKFYELVNPTK